MQIVFQDPYSSLNPQMCVRDLIGFNLRVHGERGAAVESAVDTVLADVGLAATTPPATPTSCPAASASA